MKVYTNLNNFKASCTVVTIGMFDGVHRGHNYLLDKLKNTAKKINAESVVITFWPHPRIVLYPNTTKLRYLTTINEKLELLEKANIDHVVIIDFTIKFAQKSANNFVNEILINKVNMKYLISGFDHRFGHDRKGSYSDMQIFATKYNFRIEKMDALLDNSEIISSTIIREAIKDGNINKANSFLGYDYSIDGQVVDGNKIGRSIGFPTANIKINDLYKLKPKVGVYAVDVLLNNIVYRGMLNIGYRPTLEQKEIKKTIEVHIFDFDDNIYEKEIRVVFKKKIRSEKKFNNVNELKAQLEIDKEITKDYFLLQ